MKIKDVMTPAPRTCARDTNLAAAAEIMLQGDCGILPVIDEGGRLAGVVTDRDLFIALGTRNARPSAVTIGEVMQGPATTCDPDDDVREVLQVMKDRRIRRVPVAGFGGTVIGIVSMNDLVLAAGAKKGVRDTDIVDTMRGICAHHHPAPQIAAA
jgi:CBS domain-containing protein